MFIIFIVILFIIGLVFGKPSSANDWETKRDDYYMDENSVFDKDLD